LEKVKYWRSKARKPYGTHDDSLVKMDHSSNLMGVLSEHTLKGNKRRGLAMQTSHRHIQHGRRRLVMAAMQRSCETLAFSTLVYTTLNNILVEPHHLVIGQRKSKHK
jgi:hypothetical protein